MMSCGKFCYRAYGLMLLVFYITFKLLIYFACLIGNVCLSCISIFVDTKKMANGFGSLATRLGLRKWHILNFRKNLNTAPNVLSSGSINTEEVQKFIATKYEWWAPNKSIVLHTLNSVRVPFIRDGILAIHGISTKEPQPLEGFTLLDIGCGGGILSEPLARLGATVTGLDPGPDAIEIATHHASLDETLKDRLTYVCDTAENVAEHSENKFDVVVCSEVIEHVDNPQEFVNTCYNFVKEGGSLFFTTISRTPLSYVTAILMAEYVLGIVPRGVHDWNKFITPKELGDMLKSLNCRVVSVQGYIFNPLTKKMDYCNKPDVMYALHAVK